ncbi:MAG: Mur ligase family protein [Gemmatimonadota bacterium]|nr:MAG: Mur ligase family protein [Gemmatimonadota bacterium]
MQDSRRLTGPNLVADGPGAVIDGHLDGLDPVLFRDAWRKRVREALDAVGWAGETRAERVYRDGVTVFHSAPVDVLYAATEVNEWAWVAAAADVGAGGDPEPIGTARDRLRALIDEESKPGLIALQAAAAAHGVTFLTDDDDASVGTGTGALTWPVDALPNPADVRWDEVHDVPRVLVTGTNGKTTTVRMIDAIGRLAGRRIGFTCTDGIYVDGDLLDGGDWSGPGGGRTLLRDDRVELAILETARGGMLRRGLAVDRAQGALVTNVAADHLGEWGILTVDDVAMAKLTVAKAVRHGAPMVVNADDDVLAGEARALGRPLTWIAVDQAAAVSAQMGAEDVAWVARDGWIVRLAGMTSVPVVEISAVPATLEGAAIYNVSNALGAAALASASGLDDFAIAAGLAAFDSSPDQSPGRTNLFDVGGVRVLVDFVHNPHGLEAVGRLIDHFAPERLGLMVGHAGDRDDRAILELAQAAWALHPERVAVKELTEYLRGRPPGEVPRIIRDELVRLGAAPGAVSLHPDELGATRDLFRWARVGDMLLLATQTHRQAVLALVKALQRTGWRPGASLPTPE